MDLHLVALMLQQVAAPVAQTVQSAAELTKDTNSISTTMVVSAGMAYLMQILKGASWFPLLSKESSLWYQRIFAGVVAALTSLGIHYSYTFDPVTGALNVSVLGLVGSGIVEHLVDFMKSLLMQQFTYDAAIKPYGLRSDTGK